ncbi:MAG: molybdopterin-dependent oxidoreductase [Fuerstiella sp.]
MALYKPSTDPKYQTGDVPGADKLASDVVVSSDTRRDNRIPEGQHRTRKWPVLHATSVPVVESGTWHLSIDGLVDQKLSFTLDEFRQLPRIRVFADFHCVTAWSRLGNLWEGVSAAWLLQQAGLQDGGKFATIGACDGDWTTNLPLAALQEEDVLLADTHDGRPLDPDHGGPVRLVVPRLFAWKSAKWVNRITIQAEDEPGHWERLGYHDVGDPWLGQRFRDADGRR